MHNNNNNIYSSSRVYMTQHIIPIYKYIIEIPSLYIYLYIIYIYIILLFLVHAVNNLLCYLYRYILTNATYAK